MTVALSNYPDIIQLGDAFDLRRDDWELGKRFEHTTEQEAEMPESTNQTTDLSDAPEGNQGADHRKRPSAEGEGQHRTRPAP